ncbi:Gfo/Idh/MocA family protein [Streptococcus dentiloxodontae]
MKLAIIGTGMIVKEALPVLQEIAGIELTAILSTPRSIDTARELASLYSIPQASSDYEAVLSNTDVDTVYVAVPNHLHYDYAKQALLAGKHVICEKPFTMTAGELEELAALANERRLFLLEAITNQYLPNFAAIKSQLPKLGDLKVVSCNYSQYSSRYDAFKRGEIAPAFDSEKGGGALRDLNIYNIHLLVGLFGAPQSVQYLANVERKVDTSGILVMDYGTFKAVAIGAKDCSAEIRTAIQGDKGSLAVLGPTNSLPQLSLTFNGQEPTVLNQNPPRHRMYEEFAAFEEIISARDYARADKALNHSRAVMAVLDKAVLSMVGEN